VGICADMETVYGVTAAGDAVSLFGSDTTDGNAASPVRELWTRYVQLSERGYDAQCCQLVFDIVGTAAEVLEFQITGIGAKTNTVERKVTLEADKTRYQVGVNLKAEFARIRMSYTGVTPPESIHFVGFDTDAPRAD